MLCFQSPRNRELDPWMKVIDLRNLSMADLALRHKLGKRAVCKLCPPWTSSDYRSAGTDEGN